MGKTGLNNNIIVWDIYNHRYLFILLQGKPHHPQIKIDLCQKLERAEINFTLATKTLPRNISLIWK